MKAKGRGGGVVQMIICSPPHTFRSVCVCVGGHACALCSGVNGGFSRIYSVTLGRYITYGLYLFSPVMMITGENKEKGQKIKNDQKYLRS